ncbi:MAG: hypothetical protein FWH20_09020 [Oscillospiraceae bacterium]|nr:hypothetical protein [Oscillospiraceae bacterium]
MKLSKKLLSLFVAVAMVAGMLPATIITSSAEPKEEVIFDLQSFGLANGTTLPWASAGGVLGGDGGGGGGINITVDGGVTSMAVPDNGAIVMKTSALFDYQDNELKVGHTYKIELAGTMTPVGAEDQMMIQFKGGSWPAVGDNAYSGWISSGTDVAWAITTVATQEQFAEQLLAAETDAQCEDMIIQSGTTGPAYVINKIIVTEICPADPCPVCDTPTGPTECLSPVLSDKEVWAPVFESAVFDVGSSSGHIGHGVRKNSNSNRIEVNASGDILFSMGTATSRQITFRFNETGVATSFTPTVGTEYKIEFMASAAAGGVRMRFNMPENETNTADMSLSTTPAKFSETWTQTSTTANATGMRIEGNTALAGETLTISDIKIYEVNGTKTDCGVCAWCLAQVVPCDCVPCPEDGCDKVNPLDPACANGHELCTGHECLHSFDPAPDENDCGDECKLPGCDWVWYCVDGCEVCVTITSVTYDGVAVWDGAFAKANWFTKVDRGLDGGDHDFELYIADEDFDADIVFSVGKLETSSAANPVVDEDAEYTFEDDQYDDDDILVVGGFEVKVFNKAFLEISATGINEADDFKIVITLDEEDEDDDAIDIFTRDDLAAALAGEGGGIHVDVGNFIRVGQDIEDFEPEPFRVMAISFDGDSLGEGWAVSLDDAKSFQLVLHFATLICGCEHFACVVAGECDEGENCDDGCDCDCCEATEWRGCRVATNPCGGVANTANVGGTRASSICPDCWDVPNLFNPGKVTNNGHGTVATGDITILRVAQAAGATTIGTELQANVDGLGLTLGAVIGTGHITLLRVLQAGGGN